MATKRSWTLPGSHFGGDPEFFSAWTLFDISLDNDLSKDNLRKFIDGVATRCQPFLSGVEMIEDQNIDSSLFGEEYSGKHTVWCYKWILDKQGAMSEKTLSEEFDGLELSTGARQTANTGNKIVTSGPRTNTIFIKHDSL